MGFEDLFCKNCWKMAETCNFYQYSYLMGNLSKIACFGHFSAFFAKQIPKTHKITSYFYHMRKFLTKNFLSQGTPLGSLGSLSQQDMHLGPCGFQFLVIWGLSNYPGVVACTRHSKNLKTVGARCVLFNRKMSRWFVVSKKAVSYLFLLFGKHSCGYSWREVDSGISPSVLTSSAICPQSVIFWKFFHIRKLKFLRRTFLW